MSDELKPCPFCGGPAKHGKPTISGNDAWLHIHCANRCSVAPSAHGSSVVWYWSTVQGKNVRAYSDEEAMQQATDLAYSRWNRRAQPAEAEGVDFGFDDRSVKVSQEAYSIFLEREQHHLAALSAVTAERDRLRSKWARVESERDRLLSDNASLRGSCKALGEENKQLKRENKRQGRTIAAMAAKEA